VHPPRKEGQGKETCLTNSHMLHQELPLDTRPIPRRVPRMVSQSSAMGAHSSSGITERTTATPTSGAHSSSTERVRRTYHHQARTAAPPSAYGDQDNSRAQQLRITERFRQRRKEKEEGMPVISCKP